MQRGPTLLACAALLWGQAPAAQAQPAEAAAAETPAQPAATKDPASAAEPSATTQVSAEAPAEAPAEGSKGATADASAQATAEPAVEPPTEPAAQPAAKPAAATAATAATATNGPEAGKHVEPAPAAPADYQDGPLSLALRIAAHWNTDPAWDFFSDDDVTPRFGLWAGYDILHLPAGLVLGVELGWAADKAENSILQGVQTRIKGHHFDGSAVLRHETLSFLWPHVRLAGGGSLLNVTVRSPGDPELVDQQFAGLFSLGGGLTLKLPAGAMSPAGLLGDMSIGLRIEAGYRVQTSPSFVLQTESEPEGSQIPQQTASLGSLPMNGAYLEFSIITRL